MSGILDMDYPKGFFDAYYSGLLMMRNRLEDNQPPNEGVEGEG